MGSSYKNKIFACKYNFMSSLFDQGLFHNQGGLGLGQVSMAIMFNPPLRFLTSHMNSQAMCLPFVSTQAAQAHYVWVRASEAVSIKHGLRTADHGLRTEYKTRTRYKTRSTNYVYR